MTLRILLTLIVIGLGSTARAEVEFERWYVMTVGGERAGYSHTTVERDDEHYTTSISMRLSVKRGAFALDVANDTRFVETLDGKPVEATTRTNMLNIAARYLFRDDGIEVQNLNTGASRQLPAIPGEWLAPAAASRYVEGQMAEGAERIKVRTVDVTLGPKAVELTMTLAGRENIEVLGRVVPAVVWSAESSITPGIKVQEYVDEEGRPLKSEVNAGAGLVFEMIAADKELALAKVDPPEIMASTLITPNRRIANPRALRRAVYELTVKPKEGVRPTIPATSVQTPQPLGGDKTRLTVDLDHPRPDADPGGDDPRYLAPSRVLDHADERVQRLVGQALPAGDRLPPAAAAERLRRFVHHYIDEKDLSVGFATASETAATRQGDCTEHGVLLAAMLRAAGIPSRVVSGLVYADQFLGQRGVFGYHMWTQAWIDTGDGRGRWVDLDATLDQPFDATHIALRVSAMDDDAVVNDLIALLPLLGGLEVEVIEPR